MRRPVTTGHPWAMMVSHGPADPDPARRDRVEPVWPAYRPHRRPADRPRRGGGRRARAGGRPARHLRGVRQSGRPGAAHGAARRDAPWQLKIDPDLQEWDYGGYEGRTTADIQKERPGWYLWRDGIIPGDAAHPGETVQQVGEREDDVLARAEPLLAGGDVVLVAHGHSLRVLTARYLRLDADGGRLLRLDTGTLSTLGTEHDMPVITSWNVPPTS